jgi:hypothetical protein
VAYSVVLAVGIRLDVYSENSRRGHILGIGSGLRDLSADGVPAGLVYQKAKGPVVSLGIVPVMKVA